LALSASARHMVGNFPDSASAQHSAVIWHWHSDFGLALALALGCLGSLKSSSSGLALRLNFGIRSCTAPAGFGLTQATQPAPVPPAIPAPIDLAQPLSCLQLYLL
jgi:hypothetical protein